MTTIEWTEQTWNPTTGCDRISPGCDNCYALTMAKRLKGMGSAKYQTDGNPRTSGPGFGVAMHEDTLTEPLRWKKPRRVFVNSMSDLFHADVTDEFIAHAFAIMALTPQHTYQLLTKRHGRMRSLLGSQNFVRLVDDHREHTRPGCGDFTWPLPNVWLGVSVEDQKRADLRIPALLETPAAVRFLSCEPLLGPVTLANHWIGADPYRRDEPSIGWVIAGGESGPGARALDPEWVRDIVGQCQHSGTAVFVKQLGSVWARDRHTGGKSVSAHGDTKGGDPAYWPADLRVREYPTAP